MNYSLLLKDARRRRGIVWNVQDVLREFPFGSPRVPWNQGVKTTKEEWIDQFVYLGFREHGPHFLRVLRGRFAVAYIDTARGQLFVARDWIGEEPLHCLVTLKHFIIANTIADLKSSAQSQYSYDFVRAFPQAHFQLIDLRDARPAAVSTSIHPSPPVLFYDFAEAVRETKNTNPDQHLSLTCSLIRQRLQATVADRVRVHGGQKCYLLLSGGLDSLSIALALKEAKAHFDAVTLSVDGRGGDVAVAKEFAKRLGIRHHVFSVTPEEVVDAYEGAVHISECYHIYNVYCAVGMHLLGAAMKKAAMKIAFCGEAVNEALGDYHDWTIRDAATRREIVLQSINSARLERVEERAAYAWGRSSDAGIYNKQLGTGLAKHAGSRMYKPFHHHGLDLEAPYYDPTLLAHMIAISPETLKRIDGKPGLFLKVFQQDLERLGIPKDLVLSCKKVRFQDASEGGEGGITAVLHRRGMDQKRTIELFNQLFAAHLDPVLHTQRLSCTAAA